ncbi:MAG TPA: hypothetical protein VFO39_15420 [Candidatus Sulfotelmatobacter sp.]|nr:hypothetical protein [Candidatus Sulfotelmatobacter sp.]
MAEKMCTGYLSAPSRWGATPTVCIMKPWAQTPAYRFSVIPAALPHNGRGSTGYLAISLTGLRGGEIAAELPGPGLAAIFGNMPGDEDEISAANVGNKGRHRRREGRKRDFNASILWQTDIGPPQRPSIVVDVRTPDYC